MNFQINVAGKRDLARQIYRQMRGAILNGRLRPGERLPSSRAMAEQIEVARKTVTRAYETLLRESLVTGIPGSGTYVTREVPPRDLRRVPKQSILRVRTSWAMLGRPATDESPTPLFDFKIGVPDLAHFPFALWRSLLASSGRVTGSLEGEYGDPQGDERLRKAIARYVTFTRAVVCDADQVVVTRGAQQAFDLIGRVLLNPGDAVAVEDPGYPAAKRLFTSHGAKVHPVCVDDEGVCVHDLPSQARVVYVTPSHQFPLGMPMSLERKLSLLRWAAERRACVLEDDYDSEYRFDPRPLEALQSLDKHGSVVYVGTFSKVMHPGIRVGFIVAPASIVGGLVEARRLSDSHEVPSSQLALTRFITEGHLARHVRRMSKIYTLRRDLLLHLLSKAADVFGKPMASVAGLHVSCVLESDRQLATLLRRAGKAGVGLTPIGRFAARPGVFGVSLGYGAIGEHEIRSAFRAMGLAH